MLHLCCLTLEANTRHHTIRQQKQVCHPWIQRHLKDPSATGAVVLLDPGVCTPPSELGTFGSMDECKKGLTTEFVPDCLRTFYHGMLVPSDRVHCRTAMENQC